MSCLINISLGRKGLLLCLAHVCLLPAAEQKSLQHVSAQPCIIKASVFLLHFLPKFFLSSLCAAPHDHGQILGAAFPVFCSGGICYDDPSQTDKNVAHLCIDCCQMFCFS